METMPAVLTALILFSIAPTASAAGEPILDVCVTRLLGICANADPSGISIARPAAAPAPQAPGEQAADTQASPSGPEGEPAPAESESVLVGDEAGSAAPPEAAEDVGTAAVEMPDAGIDARIPWALVVVWAVLALFLFVLLLGARARSKAKSTRFVDAVRAEAMHQDLEATWRDARRSQP